MPTYRNIAFPQRGIDLDSGRILAPGEAADAGSSERHDSLVAARLLRVETPKSSQAAAPQAVPAPQASPKAPTPAAATPSV